MGIKTLIIDNYDSFSYNIYQLVAEITGIEPTVIKNDAITWDDLGDQQFHNIIISPGAGHPEKKQDFGFCQQILKTCDVPILGICLGHQGIATTWGGTVTHAPEPMHGRITEIMHEGDVLFAHVPNKFQVVRYHSLIVNKALPTELIATAWTQEGLIMGLRHKEKPIWGVQFHPESICTEYGKQLFQNFNVITHEFYKNYKFGRHPERVLVPPQPSVSKSKYKLWVKTIPIKISTSDLYQKYNKGKNVAIWLDSSLVVKDQSFISIIGCLGGPYSYIVEYNVNTQQLCIKKGDEVRYIQGNIFDFLQQELAQYSIQDVPLPFQFRCGFVGYFGYELKQDTTGVHNRHCSEYPDAQFIFLDRAIVYDHQTNKCYLLALCSNALEQEAQSWFSDTEQLIFSCQATSIETVLSPGFICPSYELSQSKKEYIDSIQKCISYIRDGESYEICLTNKIYIAENIDPLDYYLILRQINPAPYAAFLKFADVCVASASIERFLHIDNKGFVETKPIKGTMARGKSAEEEQAIMAKLKNDIKFKSENLMIVDLLRNDLGMVCEIGSVAVPSLMAVESYATVHQLVSTICGRLKKGMTAIDCMKVCFPGGSMTGAPKIRTLEIIDQLEKSARGIYSGSIGYFSLNGAADFNIVIRTALITHGRFAVGVGGAIIHLSDPEEEFVETLLKAKSLLQAFAVVSSPKNYIAT